MVIAQDLARYMGGFIQGDGRTEIKKLSLINEAGNDDLSYIRTAHDIKRIIETKANVIITPPLLDLPKEKTYIKISDNPADIIDRVIEFMSIHGLLEKNYVNEGMTHENASVSNLAVVGEKVIIDENTVLFPNVTVMEDVYIGKGCIIYPGVVIYPKTIIGDKVILHSGCVIGSDSFEFINRNGLYVKIKNLGRVIIESEVEIGANTVIDKGTIGTTHIAHGTKIDNHVQIAHEVKIGRHCAIASQVGIAGWSTVGDRCTIYGQAGIVNDVMIGHGVTIMSRSVVTKNIDSGSVISGNPAVNHRENLRNLALIKKLKSKGV